MSTWRTASSTPRAERVRQYPAELRWCEWCGNYLGVVRGCHIREGKGRFCNRSCSAKWRVAHNDEKRLEAVRAAKASMAKYPAEPRSCLRCGKDLGPIRGSRIRAGRGKFCSHSCVMRWYWEHEPEGLRRGRTGELVACPSCGVERYREPSRVGTEYCRRCRGLTREVRAHLALEREERRRELDRIKREEDMLERREVAARLSRSPAHVTHYVAGGALRAELREIRGVVYLLCRRADVDRVARKLARRSKRVRRIRELRPRKRGPARLGPSPTDQERCAAIAAARASLGDRLSKRQVLLHAARLLAQERPWLLPPDYVADGQIRLHYDDAAIAIMKRAEKNACK